MLSDEQIEDLYFTELDNRTLSFARAIEATVLAELAKQEPVYQLCKADSISLSSAWIDVSKEQYEDAALYPEYGRRTLYTAPQPRRRMQNS